MGPSCSGSQSESRIRFILPVADSAIQKMWTLILVTRICSDDTKNSKITKCTENISFVFQDSWKDEMGIVFLRISLQAKGSSAGATEIKDFVCKLI